MGTLILLPLIFIVIAVLIGALIIQWATRLVAAFTPTYSTCIVTAIVATIAAIVLHAILGVGMSSRALSVIAGFLVNAWVINLLVKTPSGGQMGFGKAAIVSVVEYVIYLVLGLILAFAFGAAILTAIGSMSGHA